MMAVRLTDALLAIPLAALMSVGLRMRRTTGMPRWWWCSSLAPMVGAGIGLVPLIKGAGLPPGLVNFAVAEARALLLIAVIAAAVEWGTLRSPVGSLAPVKFFLFLGEISVAVQAAACWRWFYQWAPLETSYLPTRCGIAALLVITLAVFGLLMDMVCDQARLWMQRGTSSLLKSV